MVGIRLKCRVSCINSASFVKISSKLLDTVGLYGYNIVSITANKRTSRRANSIHRCDESCP
nr:MAG TPA: hypothetical protein [Caudoviricetes sp.]